MYPDKYCSVKSNLKIGYDRAQIKAVVAKEIMPKYSNIIELFSTMKEDNQVKSNSMIFEYLGIISFATTAFICALSYPIYRILFTEQYLSGYIVSPYLFLEGST